MGRARQLASNENQDRILLNASAASTDEGEHLLLDASAVGTDAGFFFNTEIGTTETPPEGFVIESSLATNAVTNTKVADDAVTVSKIDSAAQSLSNRNLIKNGSMRVHQRTGTITLGNNAFTYTLDRMGFYKSNAGTQTVEQSTDAPVGFDNSLLVKNTSEDGTVASGDRVAFIYRMEGLDAAKLEFGTVNAKTITISWYVKSTVNGKFGGAVGNGSDNRAYPFLYDIFAPNQWERKSVTLAGDTAGTWVTTNARDLQVALGLGVGSTYSGTAGAWEAADRNSATGASTTWLETVDAEWAMTGFQIEIGSEATEFEHTDIAHDIIKCQRYYRRYGGQTAFEHLPGIGQGNGSGGMMHHELPVEMRAAPTFAVDGDWRINDLYLGGYYTLSSEGIDNATRNMVRVHFATSSAIGSDLGRMLAYNDTTAKWEYKAEL